jgi:radical SAM superfamily enzyme YgiQ (UPF0313 family)
MLESALIINVPITSHTAFPYGPAVLSGILKSNGINATTWDCSIDLYNKFSSYPEYQLFADTISIGGTNNSIISKSFLRKILNWTKQTLAEKIKETNPQSILLSIFSTHSVDFAVPLISFIRKLLPDVYIIIGGRGLDNIVRETKLNYGQYYVKNLPINCAYMGDAENKLIEAIKTKKQGYYMAPSLASADLENTPAADWTGYNFEKYVGYETKELRLPITSSKGCVRQCTFCNVPSSWPKYVYRKGEDVANEIISTYQKTGIYKLTFTDNLMNGSISNFRKMNSVLAEKLPNTIEYNGYAICRSQKECPESDFELAAKAGAKIFRIGIESGSESIRNDMKKYFSNEDIEWFSDNCIKYGIKQHWLMFVGYPTETEEDFQQTMNFLDKYGKYANKNINVFLSLPMMLTHGSGFMQKHQKEYGLEHNNDRWSDFFWTSTKYPKNTFDVRVDRWKRFVDKCNEYGYLDSGHRQNQKFKEIEGLERIYKNHEKNVEYDLDINYNFEEETHL